MALKNNPDLTIVILNYNVSQLLQNCLESIFKAKNDTDSWRVIVVDNASTDDSVALVRKNYPQVIVIQNKNNLGFSAGNNAALKQVKTQFCLLLNPDTVVFSRTIQTVLQYLVSHPDTGAATCRVELPDGSLDYSCHRRFPDPWNSFVYFFTAFGKKSSYVNTSIPSQIHEIDALTGAFAMIKTSIGKKLNWLDEDFYWNGEDLDFCYRLKKLRFKVIFIPDVKITHFKGSSSGIWNTGKYQISTASKIRSVNSGIDAMRIFYDKHLAANHPAVFNRFIYLGMFILKSWRIVKIYLTGAK